MATAQIMAKMGLDASKFTANVDAAVKHLGKMQSSMEQVKKMASIAFAAGAMDRMIGAYKELKSYQETTGIKLMSDADMAQLEAAADSILRVKMQLTAFATEGVSTFMQGWKAFWAGVGSGFDPQIMASAIENIDALNARLAIAQKRQAELQKEAKEKGTTTPEKQSENAKELKNLEGQRAVLEAVMARARKEGVVSQAAELRYAADLKEIENAILENAKKRNELSAQNTKEREAQAQATEKQRNLENDLADARERGARTQAAIDAGGEVSARDKAQQDITDARRKLIDVQAGGRGTGESIEAFALRLQNAKNDMLEKERALKQLINKEDAEAKKNAEKIADDAREKAEKIQKTQLAVLKQGQKDIEEVTSGKNISRKEMGVGGGELQSIGGYFASQGAVKMAQGTRAERVQDEIKTITAKMAEDIARIANPDGGG